MSDLVVIDMDDVLAYTRKNTCIAMNSYTGQNKHYNDFYVFNLAEIYNVSPEEVMVALHQGDILENTMDIEPDAKVAIDFLTSRGKEVQILSARGWHAKGQEITERFVDLHDLKVSKVTLVGVDESKHNALSKMGPIKLFIDDHYSHIESANTHCENIKHSLLRTRLRNKNIKYSKRVDCLSEIASYL